MLRRNSPRRTSEPPAGNAFVGGVVISSNRVLMSSRLSVAEDCFALETVSKLVVTAQSIVTAKADEERPHLRRVAKES